MYFTDHGIVFTICTMANFFSFCNMANFFCTGPWQIQSMHHENYSVWIMAFFILHFYSMDHARKLQSMHFFNLWIMIQQNCHLPWQIQPMHHVIYTVWIMAFFCLWIMIYRTFQSMSFSETYFCHGNFESIDILLKRGMSKDSTVK